MCVCVCVYIYIYNGKESKSTWINLKTMVIYVKLWETHCP